MLIDNADLMKVAANWL